MLYMVPLRIAQRHWDVAEGRPIQYTCVKLIWARATWGKTEYVLN